MSCPAVWQPELLCEGQNRSAKQISSCKSFARSHKSFKFNSKHPQVSTETLEITRAGLVIWHARHYPGGLTHFWADGSIEGLLWNWPYSNDSSLFVHFHYQHCIVQPYFCCRRRKQKVVIKKLKEKETKNNCSKMCKINHHQQ